MYYTFKLVNIQRSLSKKLCQVLICQSKDQLVCSPSLDFAVPFRPPVAVDSAVYKILPAMPRVNCKYGPAPLLIDGRVALIRRKLILCIVNAVCRCRSAQKGAWTRPLEGLPWLSPNIKVGLPARVPHSQPLKLFQSVRVLDSLHFVAQATIFLEFESWDYLIFGNFRHVP